MGTIPAAIDKEVGQQLASLYELQANARYLALATTAICIWDHLITLDREIEYVWNNGRRRTFGKLLFVLVRWGITLVYPSSIWVLFLPSTTPGVCSGAYAFTYITLFLGAAGQLVLCLRVYALWNKRWWMGLTMSICWVGSLIANIGLVIVYLSGPSSQLPRTNPPITGCLRAPVHNFYIGILTSMICETIVIVATLVRVITALRSHCQDSPQKSFVRHIIHSGLGYYMLVFATLVLYIISGKTSTLSVPVLSAVPLVVVQGIACSRIMLALFSQATKHDTKPDHVSGNLVETRIGNGAPVFSKYISIGDDMWTTLGTIHYAVEEEPGGGEERNEGPWVEPEIHLEEVRPRSSESTSVEGCE